MIFYLQVLAGVLLQEDIEWAAQFPGATLLKKNLFLILIVLILFIGVCWHESMNRQQQFPEVDQFPWLKEEEFPDD